MQRIYRSIYVLLNVYFSLLPGVGEAGSCRARARSGPEEGTHEVWPHLTRWHCPNLTYKCM